MLKRVFQVPEFAVKEERRVLNVRKRRFERQNRVPGKAAISEPSCRRKDRILHIYRTGP